MNILILSCGTRNKIVQYFKKSVGHNGKIIATDMSSIAPAIYEADKYYIVPRITDSNYINVILDICKKEKVSAILSLIDPELSLLAKHSIDFKKIGVTVIGSSYDLCEMSLDTGLCRNRDHVTGIIEVIAVKFRHDRKLSRRVCVGVDGFVGT